MRVAPALAFGLSLAALARPAWAQDVAAAEALFDRGLKAMEAGDFATGCPSIEESYRLDPRAGTLFTLAECENKRGRTATAATRYEDYISFFGRLPADQQTKQGERPRIAAEQRDALRTRAPRLTIGVPANVPADAKVSRDGVDLSKPTWGVALPVDPGERVIRLEAAGHAPSEKRITIADGQRLDVQLELGAAIESAPPPTTTATPPPTETSSGLSGVQTAGLVLGGVGVVGLGLGAVFGIVTMGHASDADEFCGGLPGDGVDCGENPQARADGNASLDAASTTGLVSTIGFIAGPALLATGLVMVLAGGESETASAHVRPVHVRPVFAGDHRGGFLGAAGRF